MRRSDTAGQQGTPGLQAVAACVLLLTTAQTSLAAVEPAPAVRFRALEVHERREAIGEILSRLAIERDGRREEHRAYLETAAAAQALPTRPDDDAKLRGAMALSATLERLDSQMRESRLRRLEILDRIQAEAGRADPGSSESLRILRDSDREVRQMLSQQEDQARRLGVIRQQLRHFTDAIPPPPQFEGKTGGTMRLVGAGHTAFYVSASPVSVGLFRRFLQALPATPAVDAWTAYAASTEPESALTGVSWHEARRFCEWLSQQEGTEYRLPTTAQAEAIAAVGSPDRLAFWSADVWAPADHTVRRDLKRFAVSLATVWDPDARLVPDPGAFGDVPFARYRDLTVYVVTPRQTGIAQRWQRLKVPPP